MAFVIDEIWYLRNCSLHNRNQPNIQPSSLRIRDRSCSLHNIWISQSNSQTLRPLINTCWTPPPQDWIKENVHAAISTSLTALAAIARDHAGKVMHVWIKMHKPCSPLQAEAFALLWAVQQSSLNGWPHVVFESDSKECIYPPSSSLCTDWSISTVLSNVLNLAFSFNKCSFSLVRRSGNSTAHTATRITVNSNLPVCLNNDNLPVALQSVGVADCPHVHRYF